MHRPLTRALAAAPALLLALAAAACLGRATPSERWYVDPSDRAYDWCLRVLRDLGGEVVSESRQARSITARFPEEVFGHGVYLDVWIERREDENLVRAEARGESASVPKEDLELLRDRFYDALDAAWEASGERDRGGVPRPPGTGVPLPPTLR